MENTNTAPRLPRKRRSLAQELVTVLSEQIRDGQLKRGDKLPTESAIMDAHGVS
ncbi:GntR family transcriptional regulator, partial [Pseudomonas sp. KHB2.9]